MFTFKETSKGGIIGLGNLHEYVEKERSLGKCTENSTDYICECPNCKQKDPSYEKLKLYVKKDFSVAHCFRCDVVLFNNVISEKDTLPKRDDLIKHPPKYRTLSEYTKEIKEVVDFSQYDDSSTYSLEGINYLVGRLPIYKKSYLEYGIRFSEGKVIVPFLDELKEPFYFQIRFLTPYNGMKYYTPKIEYKPIFPVLRNDNPNYVICEGVFDAIACTKLFNCNVIACLGSYLSTYQLNMIDTLNPSNFLIYMDETRISFKLSRKIAERFPLANITIFPSNGPDPEEFLAYRLSLGYSYLHSNEITGIAITDRSSMEEESLIIKGAYPTSIKIFCK